MSYELRKILGNRYVMLLLALAVAVNAALFYRRCTKDLGGFTRADIRAEYAHLDTLEQERDDHQRALRALNENLMHSLSTPCSTESTSRTSISCRCRTRTSGATPC